MVTKDTATEGALVRLTLRGGFLWLGGPRRRLASGQGAGVSSDAAFRTALACPVAASNNLADLTDVGDCSVTNSEWVALLPRGSHHNVVCRMPFRIRSAFGTRHRMHYGGSIP